MDQLPDRSGDVLQQPGNTAGLLHDWQGTDPVKGWAGPRADLGRRGGIMPHPAVTQSFLFALGTTEPDPQPGPDLLRGPSWWSHPCEPNGVPYLGRSPVRTHPALLDT